MKQSLKQKYLRTSTYWLVGALGGKRTSALPYGFGVFPQPLSCQHRSTRPRATAFKMAFSFFFQVRAFLLQPPSPSLVLLLRLHIHAPAPAPMEHQSTAQVCCNPYLGAACVLCAVSCDLFTLCFVLQSPPWCCMCFVLCPVRFVLCAICSVQQFVVWCFVLGGMCSNPLMVLLHAHLHIFPSKV